MGISYQQEAQLKKRRQHISRANRVIFSVAITAGAAVYVLFFAGLFDVRAIAVEAPSRVSIVDVERVAWQALALRRLGIPRKNNILLFSPDRIRPLLLDTFPRIDSVDIRRTSLHGIAMTVHERVPVGLWCFPQHCYYFDAGGIAFSEIASSSGFLFVAVHDARDRDVKIGERVAPESWREHILEAKKILQFGGINVANIAIPLDSYDEFHITTSEGWTIYYSNDTNVRRQTDDLLLLLKEKITAEARKNLEYVDLRIEERIYYKMR